MSKFTVLILSLSLVIIAIFAQEKSLEDTVKFASTAFCYFWYIILSKAPGNIVYSPVSSHLALASIYQATKAPTSENVAKVLFLPDQSSTSTGFHNVLDELSNLPNISIDIVNEFRVKNSEEIKSDFKTDVEGNFGTSIKSSEEPGITVVSSIKCKAAWAKQFDQKNTQYAPFYLDNDTSVSAQMMTLDSSFKFKVDESLNARVIELPFNNDEVSMFIVLPFNKDGLKALEARTLDLKPENIRSGLEIQKVKVSLPKINLKHVIDYETSITEMGLGDIFDATKNVFNIFEEQTTYVNKISHEAYMNLNERGLGEISESDPVEENLNASENEFIADHPFLFSVTHWKNEQDHFIYGGRILNPTES